MNVAPTDPLAVRLTTAVDSVELHRVRRLPDQPPELAYVRIGGPGGGWHTPLHVATDWPGSFPNGPEGAPASGKPT